MKYVLTAVVVSAALANAVEAAAQPISSTSQPSKGPDMYSITLGEHSKLSVPPSEQGAVRKFFRDVLGAPQTRETERSDIFQLGPHFYLGVVYDNNAPTTEAQLKSIWLELRTSDPVAMKAKILSGGGREIEFRDKEHFYFQAPGGQVFRLISDTEDMSRWQR